MKDRIATLLHLYEDGALNRRELVRRLTQHTGTVAAAMLAIESAGLAQTAPPACPANVQVPETDRSVISQMLTLHGEASPLFAYQSLPADIGSAPRPAVLVIHENRGLNEHIKDVNRRIAKAGYVALAVDLLSRVGGTSSITDPEAAVTAYNQTTVEGRRQDMLSALYTIRDQSYVRRDRLGAIGFCAGGGNVWDLATITDQLKAAVVYYGPPAASEAVPAITTPMLLVYAELDRGLNARLGPAITALNAGQKRYELFVYGNTNHAFNNDTGARYDPTASCDAFARTLSFFNRNLNA